LPLDAHVLDARASLVKGERRHFFGLD